MWGKDIQLFKRDNLNIKGKYFGGRFHIHRQNSVGFKTQSLAQSAKHKMAKWCFDTILIKILKVWIAKWFVQIAKCISCTDVTWCSLCVECKTQQGTKWLNGVLTRHNINGGLPRDNWSKTIHLLRSELSIAAQCGQEDKIIGWNAEHLMMAFYGSRNPAAPAFY